MEWRDDGIVVARRRHGDSSLVCTLLTRGHGLHAGLARGAAGPRARAGYEIGNRLSVVWRGRLAEHLGTWRAETAAAHAAALLHRPHPLLALGAAAALVEAVLPEREPNGAVFDSLAALLDDLAGAGWRAAYARFELHLLAALGYGLDLDRCAVTGAAEGLAFVSPRTGRAVSRSAGAPYEPRLLALPRFLTDAGRGADAAEFSQALRLTGHFFDHRALRPAGRALPGARAALQDAMLRRAAASGGEAEPDRDD